MSKNWDKFVKQQLPEYGIQKGSQFEAKLYLAFAEMESLFSIERSGLKYKISKLEKENAELKAKLAHVEREYEKEKKVSEYYGEALQMKGMGWSHLNGINDDWEYLSDREDFIPGRRARQRIKERKEFS